MPRLIRTAVLLILSLSMATLTAFAQFLSGIEGTVRDASGAIVAGAKVTITDNGLQASRTATSNDAGYFRIDSIAESTYTVRVEMAGFKVWEQKSLAIEPGKLQTIAPVMQAGSTSEEVTVTAEGPALNLATPTTSSVIALETIQETPLSGQNVYGVAEGFRRDFGDSRRVMILARASYLGAQRNGTVFWSSDIVSTWDMLNRSIPAGLNFVASGMPYWDTDIAGFFSPAIPADYHTEHKPLIDRSDVRDTIGNYEDYPELFVRWFEWGAFHPVMRAHGERNHNEVWSYGKQAEPILAKYLKLRYQLLPYTYSVAYRSYETGAPYMRALFMNFPHDPKALNVPDEYMYGPAFLVAPVTEQGAMHRQVYLPAGCNCYNYWTNERLHGGQTITADAPIDTLPLFVRAGRIVPLGSNVQSAQEAQTIVYVRVYPGANGSFALHQDDGKTYAYEKDGGSVTELMWDDAAHKLKREGAPAWSGPDNKIVEVVHP
jgi:hypothetical protein